MKRLAGFITLLLLLAAASTMLAGSGGPDSFGYVWRDSASGATYSWIEISGSGTNLAMADETLSPAQNLGFTVNFYGTNYTQIKVSSNGWVTFLTSETSSNYTNTAIPSAVAPQALIAGFWDDLNAGTGGAVYYQAFATYAVIEWDRVDRYGTSNEETFQIIINSSGTIKVQYKKVEGALNLCTVGIENSAGTVGLQCLFDGAASGGFALSDTYAVEFYIPFFLNCSGSTAVSCDTTLVAQGMGPANNAIDYGCNGLVYNGLERIFRLDLATTQNLDVAISNFGAEALDVFLLNACNEITSCLAGGGDTLAMDLLAPGTYYLVVDGETNADNGPFDIQIECNPSATLACPAGCVYSQNFEGCAMPAGWTTEVITGNAWNVANNSTYACAGSNCYARYPYNSSQAANSWLYTGGIPLQAGTTYTLNFDRRVASATYPENMNVWIGNAANSASMTTQLWNATGITAITCATQSPTFTVPVNGTYFIGFHCTSAANMFDMIIDNVSVCAPAGYNCSSAQAISCPFTGSGTTTGGTSVFDKYSCSNDTYAGQEKIYTVTVAQTTLLDISLTNFGGRDMEMFLLSGCDPCTCLARGATISRTVGAGTYFIVVDGFTAADNGPFDITVSCTDPCLAIPVISCNIPVSGNTSDDTNDMNPVCGSGAGKDEMWKFFYNGPIGSNLTISMPTPAWDHVLYVLDNCLDPASCVAWADSGNINLTTTTSPQTYFITVDGYSAAASGAYSNLLVTCPLPNNINCATATPIACGSTASGDTIGKPNNASEYAGVGGTFAGSEIIYALTLTATKNLDIYLEGHAGRRMYAFLLQRNTCNVNNVIEGGVGEIHYDGAIAGTYYIIVDGRTPADNGAFTLRVVCNDPATASCGGCTYTVTEPAAFSWIQGNPGTQLTLTDDQNSGFVPLGFTFNYDGVDYTQIAICSNGWASFTDATSTAYGNVAIPTAALPNAMLAPFWDDLDPSLAGTIYYRSMGSAPNRTFVIEWEGVRHHTLVQTYSFEIVLYETSNLVRFQYETMGTSTSSTIGVESASGTAGCQRYFDNTPPVPALTNYAILFTPGAAGGGPNCAAATAVSCNSTVSGSTAGLANNVNSYSCAIDTYAGFEKVYQLTLAQPEVIELSLYNFGNRELDVFLLSSCNQCACIAGGTDDVKVALNPGTYYIVVDGFTAADNGSFDLSIVCTACSDAGGHSRWSVCENPRAPITAATTSALEWYFDDCDYCRQPPNSCFTTPCTFDMYIVAECGTQMHMPLYDNETGDLKIYDMTRNEYVYLFAQSTGGWTAEGLQIAWQDCGGVDPRWNDQTTDIWFNGNPTLCGVYRAEFRNWGGFIWDLFSNCAGTDTPGFRLYDNYCEALANYDPFPSLSVQSMTITGTCPTYTVNYTLANAGCAAASTTVVVTSDLGGSAEQAENNIPPGGTRSGSMTINVQNGGSGNIYAYADFYGGVFECQEAGAVASACNIGNNGGSAFETVNCTCVIPQFSTVQVEDLACPVGLRLFWNAATFASGNGHYDIYRSTISFADAVASPALATNITALEYLDNATTPGSTYYYVVRAEDVVPTGAPCIPGGHGGLYTDVNAGPITDNLSQNQDKPFDIGNDLRITKLAGNVPHCDWTVVVPHPNTTHWHVYRSTVASAIFPDLWSMRPPEWPNPGYLPPGTKQWDDTAAPAALYFYDVRSANTCEDISPGILNADFVSTSPSCNGSGLIDFTSQLQGGVPPYAYNWNFGDGSPDSNSANPSHTYTLPPYTRNVSLTITDSTVPVNQVDTMVKPVYFGTGVTAFFTYSSAGLTVTFNGTGGGGTGSYAYSWSFGDNTSQSVEDPVHTYSSNGTYTVTLRVTDANSTCSTTTTQDISL